MISGYFIISGVLEVEPKLLFLNNIIRNDLKKIGIKEHVLMVRFLLGII